MTLLALTLAVLCGPLQEEALYRQRIEALVTLLDAEQTDDKALRDLTNLPTSTIPLILELAPANKFPRASKRIAAVLPPEPWGRFLRTSIRNALDLREIIVGGRSFDRRRHLDDVVLGMACLPPAEAKSILDGFARAKNPVLQELARDVSAYLQPDKGAKYGRLLDSPASCERGADLVILTGETSALRQAVELFCRQEAPESMAAARVLEVFGAGPHADRILGVFQGKGPFAGSDSAIRILERTGGKKVEDALLAALKGLLPGSPRGYTLIRALQTLDCHEAGPAIRDFLAGFDKAKLKSLPAMPLIGVESAIQRLEDIRREDSRFGPMRLKELHPYAYPGLRPAVLEWVRDPNVKPSDLKWLLPVLGATGGKEDATLLLEKLQDPRCAPGAAEGLAMIGDPAHAREVWKAYSRAGPAAFLNNSMVSFPPEALEAELVAAISSSSVLDRRVLQLIGQGGSAAIRKAIFDRLLDPNPRGLLGWDLVVLLGEGRTGEEKAWVEKIRGLGPRTHSHYGHFLAMRQGDASAAGALADALSSPAVMFQNPRMALVWKACEAAGENWKKAVAAAWTRNPNWTDGLLAMSRWGHKEAVDQVRKLLEQQNFGYREHVLKILAKQGDAKAQEWLLEQLARKAAHEDEYDEPVLELIGDPAFLQRVLALARIHCQPGRPGGRTLAILADRTVTEARPLFLVGTLKESIPCLRAMFRLKDPEAFGLAVKLLGSGGPYARLGAVRALEEWGGRAAVSPLVSRLDDMDEAWDVQVEHSDNRLPHGPHPRIAVAAMGALEKLTGVKPAGTSHAERRVFWKDWYAKNRDAWK